MNLFVLIFSFFAFSISAEGNYEIVWKTVVPRSEVPGFWDGREFIKRTFLENQQRAGRIVGGEVATPHSHPYQVGLLLRFSVLVSALCGGSLITNRAVLTAGHCPEGTLSLQVILGAHQITSTEPSQQRQTVSPLNYRFHPEYNINLLKNDVAIVILPNPATLNSFVSLAILPALGETETFAGEMATVSGWGRTSDASSTTSAYLRSVQNSIMTNTACEEFYGQVITESIICMSTVGGRGTCNSDSGGPLTVDSRGGRLQVGIVSFGIGGGCELGFPSGFARVTSFRQWINDNQTP